MSIWKVANMLKTLRSNATLTMHLDLAIELKHKSQAFLIQPPLETQFRDRKHRKNK